MFVTDPRRLAEVVMHGLSLPHDNWHFGLNGQIFDMDELVESLVRAYLGAVEENERLNGSLTQAYLELDEEKYVSNEDPRRLAEEALAKAQAVKEPGRWQLHPDDPHAVRLLRVIVGSYHQDASINICEGVPRDIAAFVGFMSPEKVSALTRALLDVLGENERLKGYERSVDAYMEATKNYQRSLQIEQAKVEELEEEMRGYKVEVAVARDHYRSLASEGFGEVSLPWYWNEQADRVDKLLEREGSDLQRRST